MLSIHPIPAFADNYFWLIADETLRQAAVVDPGDAGPVRKALEARGLELTTILVTHHHPDHIGGLDALIADCDPAVYGPRSARIPQITTPLAEGDSVSVIGCDFRVLEVPGHTLDHIAFYSENCSDRPVLFCGDTLFAGGCGRLFEGTAAQMVASLDKLASLPADTAVYCAHEYTQNNLRFALAVEPDNSALVARMKHTVLLREQQLPTVPSTMSLELETNPFLRCDLPSVQSAVSDHNHPGEDRIATFAALRHWKDGF